MTKTPLRDRERSESRRLNWMHTLLGGEGFRTCSTDEEEFLSANIPGNVLRSSETHLISKTSGMHRFRLRSC